uniref:Glycerol-3-phosphate dehydrogenase [NAD(+)] n=1 Tax=Timema bartmani TaxID=61472 RepID=A0A7R9F531_9NEOP|nr:unnamed protein product [Timema bartmani]
MKPDRKKRVCVLGSGNWGTVIAKIVGSNSLNSEILQERVSMYVYEEELEDGRKLSEVINERHENVKYLPGHELPPNVVAVTDATEAVRGADVLVFVMPRQFVRTLCATLVGQIKPTAVGVSLIKGFDDEDGPLDLVSNTIARFGLNPGPSNTRLSRSTDKRSLMCWCLLGFYRPARVIQVVRRGANKHKSDVEVRLPPRYLKIRMCVLMGANNANEVAAEKLAETTIGCKDKRLVPLLKAIFQTDNFKVRPEINRETNVVACAAGFVDGLELGSNAKAAVVRLGLLEMVRFVDNLYPGSRLGTFFQSCGVADLMTTCYGGLRDSRVAAEFAKSGRALAELEEEMLGGRKLQARGRGGPGTRTAFEVNRFLTEKKMEEQFPLFTAVHLAATGVVPPNAVLQCVRDAPDYTPMVRNLLVM